MSQTTQISDHLAQGVSMPTVIVEVQQGNARANSYPIGEAGFLIGSVPGCDLRIPGANLPPVIAIVSKQATGLMIRKMTPLSVIQKNGVAIGTSPLQSGDVIEIGTMRLRFNVTEGEFSGAASTIPAVSDEKFHRQQEELASARNHLQQQIRRFREQVVQFDQQRSAWEAQRTSGASGKLENPEVGDRERFLTQKTLELKQQKEAIAEKEAEIRKQQQEMNALRAELAEIRKQLYDRYQERRDRLSGLQEAVNRAAKKVQDRKKTVDAEQLQLTHRQQQVARSEAELESRIAELSRRERKVAEAKHFVEHQVHERTAECEKWENRLASENEALKKSQEEHRADLVRLDRLKATLEEKETYLHQREEEMALESRKLEEQVVQLDEWHSRLRAMAEQLNLQKQEIDEQQSGFSKKVAALEGQQGMLTNLKARLEQMRDEIREREQQLTNDQERHSELETKLETERNELQQLRLQLDQEQAALEQERSQITERKETLENAVAQLREAQQKLEQTQMEFQEEKQAYETEAANRDEKMRELQELDQQLTERKQRIDGDRQALLERMQLLSQAEQARETLQEQLRKRSEELANRQRSLDEQTQSHRSEVEEFEQKRQEFQQHQEQHNEMVQKHMQEIETKAQEIGQHLEQLSGRENKLQEQMEKLQDQARQIAEQKKQVQVAREELQSTQAHLAESNRQAQAEFEAVRNEAMVLQEQLPDLELRAGTVFDRLSYARDQLREHINEVHAYAIQCEEHLDSLRSNIHSEGERLHIREHTLRKQQDDQRLALAAFRQQLIDWQGQVAEMNRLLAENGSRLDLRHAQVTEKAKHIDSESSRLARQAEELELQQQEVVNKRNAIDYHLQDMQDWYRQKLRELAGVTGEEMDANDNDTAAKPNILSLTGNVDEADRTLGDLLQQQGLIDGESLTALLVEARRQRRSLRDILLADGTVTPYQMKLIEAGDLDGLMLGTMRVVDCLSVKSRETVYRVFDPEIGVEARLRHLSEKEMEDAAHPDEFRQRFSHAMIDHLNVAKVLGVHEIDDRPAVLLESTPGLTSDQWPGLTAIPGVFYKLVKQSARALAAIHSEGLVHGHLSDKDFLLTEDGTVKLCSVGEPDWLVEPPPEQIYHHAAEEMAVFGGIINRWSALGGNRGRGFPPALMELIDRCQPDAENAILSATELLDQLEMIGDSVPANAEAWDRTLKQIRNQIHQQDNWKKSA